MSLAVIRSIPIGSSLVPFFLEDIIDRKIAKVALNILEEIADWILSWIYSPYYQLYQEKKERIHTFSDGLTRLIDSTKHGVANIDVGLNTEYVSLFSFKVLFTPNPNFQFTFSRQTNCDYVVVYDDKQRGPGWYKIIEQEIARATYPRPMKKCWNINTCEVHKLEQGNIERDFLIVEQPRPIRP